MINLLDYDRRRVDRHVKEFVAAMYSGQDYLFTCTYRSNAFADERQIFVLEVAGKKFALKLDTQSAATKRLEQEFSILTSLRTHFQGHDTLDVIAPVYLSKEKTFFITEFVDRKTATAAIYEQPMENRVRQVYRRAGLWLHELYAFSDIVDERFWFQWMFENLDKLTGTAGPMEPHAEIAEYGPMIDQLMRDADKLDGVRDIKVFSHGDFHGRNLILGAGVTYGLDFTEVGEKLAVYDIVDFLKADVFRDADQQDVDRSGITRANKEMFLRLYRHPVNIDVLDFCMRARLLIDWLSISAERFARTNFQRTKFGHLRRRLLFAFQHEM